MKTLILSNIRKKLILSAILTASLGLTSCSDWLEMEAYTSDDIETTFSDEVRADKFVQGCYRGLIHNEMYYQLGMGETVMHSCEDGSTNNSKYMICNYKFDALIPATVTTIYKEQYRIIEATNIAISNLNKMPETNKRNQLLGEAICIRAFCYLNLIRIYGDVPAVYTPLERWIRMMKIHFIPSAQHVMIFMIESYPKYKQRSTGCHGLKRVTTQPQSA